MRYPGVYNVPKGSAHIVNVQSVALKWLPRRLMGINSSSP